MTTLTEAERRYDAERTGTLYTPITPALLSLTDQIAQCSAGCEEDSILLGTLPGGVAVTRGICDGAPNEWIHITRGDVAIDIRAGGTIAGIDFADCYLAEEDFSLQDLDDLRTLLTLDRMPLGQVADLGSEITQAIKVWGSLSYTETECLVATTGFAQWLHDPNRPRECQPRPIISPVVEAPAPVYVPDRTSINHRAGAASAVLTFLLRALDADRADRLIALLDLVEQAPAVQRDCMVDALLAAVSPLGEPAAPAVTVQRVVCDDAIDSHYGQEIGTVFSCAEAEVYFPDVVEENNYPTLSPTDASVDDSIDIEGFDLKYAERFLAIFPKVTALLGDRRVQELRRGEVLGL